MPNTAKIKIVTRENPRRPGSDAYKRYAVILKKASGKTLEQAVEAGVPRPALTRAQKEGHISVGTGSTKRRKTSTRR